MALSVVLIYGVMGFSGIWLGVGTSMFAAIAIGTGVDFAVHMLDRIMRVRRDRESRGERRDEEVFSSTGRALLFSGACLVLGFAVLMISEVPSLGWLGFVIAVAVSTSFVASVTVLPALIKIVDPAFARVNSVSGSQ